MNNIAVVFGGPSVEHDVSVITGLKILKSLRRTHKLIPIYFSLEGEFFYLKDVNFSDYTNKNFLKKNGKRIEFCKGGIFLRKKNKLKRLFNIDFAINCCHGGKGESGELSAYLKMNDIRCSGGNNPICSNKFATKQFVKGLGVNCANSVLITNSNLEQKLIEIKQNFSDNLIAKPNNLGSSIGVIKTNFKNLKDNLELLLHLDSQILVEEYIKDVEELHCAVVNNKRLLCVSEIEKILLNNDIYSFEDKYINNLSKKEIPANIDEKIKTTIYNWSKTIYEGLNLSGVIEFQFFYDKQKEVLFFNEVNNVPKNLAYKMFEGLKINLKMLIDYMLNGDKGLKKQTYFESDVLSKIDLNF